MTAPVNWRVTPALDPETYLAVEGVNDSTRGYIDDVVSLMNDCYATLGKLHSAKDAVDSNPAWTAEQKVLMMSAETNKQKDRLAQRLDRTVRDLESRIAHTEQELLKPVQQGAAVGPLASEVRAHFKALDNAQRSKLIREALEANDEPTLQAVLGAQAFLSGMNNIDKEHFIGLYHAKRQPHLVERRDVMVRVRDLLDSSNAHGTAFHKAFDLVRGAPAGEARALEKADAAARAALNIQPS